VAIVALWAAHLLPQWIRRRDALGAARADDRHSAGLRLLARRRHRPPQGRSTAPLLPSVPVVTGPPPGPASLLPLAGAAPTPAARRRRTVLAALVTVTLLAVTGALTGAVPAGFAVVCVVLLALDLTALRRVAVAERRRRAEEFARARRAAARAARAARPEPIAAPVAPQAPEVEAPDAVEPAPHAEPIPAAVDDGTWVPVPVPPPTYTLKPVAHRAEPAPLEPALDPAAAASQPAAAAQPVAAEVDLDSVLERRRAVNG
jgi:hypothetical protein